jgi:Holliday junction resolvase RusA-like endonuclease
VGEVRRGSPQPYAVGVSVKNNFEYEAAFRGIPFFARTFRIPGAPAPWQVYTRQGPPPIGVLNCQAYQEQLRAYLRSADQWGSQAPLTGPVTLDTEFWLRWPQTAPTKRPEAIARWRREHLAMKPDIDNLRKACSDALQNVLYVNDSQVVGGRLRKNYLPFDTEGCTIITVRPVLE